MRQNRSNIMDSANKNRRGRRKASQERSRNTNQNQAHTTNNNSSDLNKKISSQLTKKENSKDAIRAHFGSIISCLKSSKKKHFLLKLAGKTPEITINKNPTNINESAPVITIHKSFISDFFFDITQKRPPKSNLNSQASNETLKTPYSNEARQDKNVGQSKYFPIQRPPIYSDSKPHFVDFICNSLYKVQALGGEGENKKVNDSNDSSPPPAEYANSILSENIDLHSIKVIKYNKLFLSFLDPDKKLRFAKSHQMTNEEEVLNYIVDKKISLDELLQDFEDDKRFITRTPINLCLNDPNITLPSFKFCNLYFLYYIIILIESRTTLTPHNRRPISICLKHLIPILLAISNPVITPLKQTEYYQSLKSKLVDHPSQVVTSLSPFSSSSIFDKKIKELLSFSPQFSFAERDWPCHLLLPPLFIRYLIILFDLLSRLDEYLQEIPFIPYRASFGLNDAVRADLTLDYVPNEFKRLLDSVEKGGSLAQKLYNLRNISYQIISVNGLYILDRELQIIENIIESSINPNHNNKNYTLTEEIFLEKMRHDIIDQKPYKLKFLFDENGEEIGFNFQKSDKGKLHIAKKFDETYVFPNYSINILQPKHDPTLVKYDGILKSNMTFRVTGSIVPGDDQFHVQLTEDSYGIICNYTDLI